MAKEGKKLSTVEPDWNEVYYTNCPLVSASNVDQDFRDPEDRIRAASGDSLGVGGAT